MRLLDLTIIALHKEGTAAVQNTLLSKSDSGSRAGAKDKAEYTVFISGNRKMSVEKLKSMCSRFGLALEDDYEYSLPVDFKDKHCKLSFKTEVAFRNFVESFNNFHKHLETDDVVSEQNLLPILNRFTINKSHNNGNVIRYICRPDEARVFKYSQSLFNKTNAI